MKAKLLSFAFFSFHFLFGNGSFQRVTAEKTKKFLRLQLAPRLSAEGLSAVHTLLFSLSPAVLTGSAVSINRNPNIASRDRKDFVDAIAFCASETPIVSMT
jgi:hypothetical protein